MYVYIYIYIYIYIPLRVMQLLNLYYNHPASLLTGLLCESESRQ